jgi:cobalt/nickel transport system permease protein
MCAIAVFAAKLRLREYVYVLALPVSFLLMGATALLFDISATASGVINIKAFNWWLVVSSHSQAATAVAASRALGAVSAIALLSATTPMQDIIAALQKLKCPSAIIDLMYLTYRYIFILQALNRDMQAAATSRLGFSGYKASIRSTAKIYAGLLARSYHNASINFDAMESRCFESGIAFLDRGGRATIAQGLAMASLIAIALGINIFF